MRWRVTNEGDAVHLIAIAAPHARFRSPDHDIDVSLAAGGVFEPQLEIASAEPAGTDIENASLIVTAEAGALTWRISARLRVRVDANGVPHPATEGIDVREAGSSEEG